MPHILMLPRESTDRPQKEVEINRLGRIMPSMTKQEITQRLSERLDEIRHRFAVQRLALFGSAVRSQMNEASDIDVLVAFNGKATFDAFMDLKFYLEDLLGAPVDLVTDNALRPQVRSAIEGELTDVA